MKFFLQVMLLCLSTAVVAQTQVSGTVTDSNGQPVPGASVVLDSNTGTVTDFDGNFSLNTSKTPPFNLTVSNVGLETKTVNVSSATQSLSISLGESATQLDEIVVSASRFAQRIFESPVTVEKFSLRDVENTPSADFYNGLANMKGVNLIEGGILFSQPTVRGFSDIYNEGLVQLVDGMNNQMPVFGFAVGNLVGPAQIDILSMELLPGAASSLYGESTKGILFMNTKNPFDFPGITVQYKSGVTDQDTAGSNEFHDISIRMATKLSDKWAIKATLSHKEGTEWSARDNRHVELNPGGRTEVLDDYDPNRPDYNGVNIEGERLVSSPFTWSQLPGKATELGFPQFGPLLESLASISPNYFDEFRTTGYSDYDMFGDDTYNTKGNFAIHFRPNENSEFSLQSLVGTGNTVLSTGGTRYHLKDFKIQQHKLDYKSGGLSARYYYTKEDAGSTNISGLMALGLQAKQPGGVTQWLNTYLNTYLGGAAIGLGLPAGSMGLVGLLQNVAGHIQGQAAAGVDPSTLRLNDLFGGSTLPYHMNARAAANANMLQPGTTEFSNAVNELSQISGLERDEIGFPKGALFLDVSTINNFEIDYDFGDKVAFGSVLLGANYRAYDINSSGTIFNDKDAPFKYYQYGFYGQLTKDLFDDAVTLSASLRYDKDEVLEKGNITPRIGLMFNLSENQNIRISAQRGFRNPTNQDKFIAYNQGGYTILGSSKMSLDKLNYAVGLDNGTPHMYTGDEILNNAVDIQNYEQSANLDYVKAETIDVFEVGYRYNSSNFTLDANVYYSAYTDYISGRDVYVPVYTSTLTTATDAINAGNFWQFEVDGNLNEDVNAYGGAIEAVQILSEGLVVNLSYEYNKLDYTPSAAVSGDEVSWNTPLHRIKAGLNFNKGNFNFGANARYNSEIDYRSSFFDAYIDPNTVIDAKMSLKLPSFDSVLELGANNISGENFVMLPGSGLIGSTYYVGIRVDL